MFETARWDEEELRQAITAAKKPFGEQCPKKFVGAVTSECIREALASHDILTTPRDVFIEGVCLEIDLLVLRDGAIAENAILYKPEDVLAAFEIKNHGVFGKGSSSCEVLQGCFWKILRVCPDIWCAYVTLSERESFSNKITTEKLGFPAYTLFWSPTAKTPVYRPTGHWAEFVAELKRHLKRATLRKSG